jgi:uncharacterized protein (TIGR00288 family)
MNEMNESRVAVLIDYENALNLFREKEEIPRGHVDWAQVVATARRFGGVLICKAYADWDGNIDVRDRIMLLGIEPVTVPKGPRSKNGVDVKIAVDAIDMTVINDPDIRSVIIVSGDGDFTPLVHYLKNHGKYVVGMGIRGSTATFLESACHEFLYLRKDDREPAPSPDFPSDQPDTPPAGIETVQPAPPDSGAACSGGGNGAVMGEAREILRKSLESADGEWMLASVLKNKMLELMPGFDEANYGFARFRAFLDAQADMTEVRRRQQESDLEIRLHRDGACAGASNPADALVVEKYVSILRKKGLEIRPNEDRPLIMQEAYALYRANGGRTFLKSRDELQELFKKKHPKIMLRHVLDLLYHIKQASCLEWEIGCGRFPADTPLPERKCRLSPSINSADELLRKVDAHLLSVVAAGVKPEAVDAAAAAHLLYGRKANGETAAYVAGLLEALPAPPSAA